MNLNKNQKQEFYDNISKVIDSMNFISTQENMADWNENINNGLYCAKSYIENMAKLFDFKEFEDKSNQMTKSIIQNYSDKIKELESSLLKKECNVGVILKNKFKSFDEFIKENYFSVCDKAIECNIYTNETYLKFDLSCYIHIPSSIIYAEKTEEIKNFENYISKLENLGVTLNKKSQCAMYDLEGTQINIKYLKSLFQTKYPSFKLTEIIINSSCENKELIRKIKGMININCI